MMSHCTSPPPPASSEQGLMRTGALTKPLPGTQNTRLSENARSRLTHLFWNTTVCSLYMANWPGHLSTEVLAMKTP
jgi:hypothetical protein